MKNWLKKGKEKKKVPEYKNCPVSKETLKPRKKEEGLTYWFATKGKPQINIK